MLDVDVAEEGPAVRLLAIVSTTRAVIEQFPRSHRVRASVYIPERSGGVALRAARTWLGKFRRDGDLQSARLTGEVVQPERLAQAWKRRFAPARVASQLWIVPPWRRAFRVSPGEQKIVLNPGMAFGTGRHASTRLALRLLLEHVHNGSTVIDAGCGSGILGIAAAQRGARAWCFDCDPDSVRAARENFARNGLTPEALRVSDDVPRDYPRADVIVANIDAPTLHAMARRFAAKLVRSGLLLTSGIEQHERLETLFHFARAGLEFVAERRRGRWCAYTHARAA